MGTRQNSKQKWHLNPVHFNESEVDAIVEKHMPLVRKIAKRYSQYSPDSMEDLVQVGSIGLLKAIGYYDPERSRSASFKTLAICYIRGEIRHYLRDQASLVQVPRKLTEIQSQISKLEESLSKEWERMPTVEELSKHSGIPVNEILEAQRSKNAKLHYESFDCYSQENEKFDNRNLQEVVADYRYEDLLKLSEDREQISQALKELGEKTRKVVEFVFFYDLSQKETACVLGLSEMGVSRAVHSALKKLKKAVNPDDSKSQNQKEEKYK